jgi:ribosomal protein S27AE
MKLDDLGQQVATDCFSCGRSTSWLHSVNAMNPAMKACAVCISKHGEATLRDAADRILAAAVHSATAKGRPCGHCGETVMPDAATGMVSIMCGRCEYEWRHSGETVN